MILIIFGFHFVLFQVSIHILVCVHIYFTDKVIHFFKDAQFCSMVLIMIFEFNLTN